MLNKQLKTLNNPFPNIHKRSVRIDISHITQRAKQLLAWLVQKDALIYLLFVGLATLFWWGRAMSSQREVEVKLPVAYTQVPAQVVFNTPLPNQIEVVLRDNGRLLRQVQHTKPMVTIPLADKLNDKSGTLLLSTDVLRQKIQDNLPGSTNIQQINPEEITSTYYPEATKTVPVKLCATWTLEQQYQLAVPPILQPAQVDIYGTQEAIDQIDSICTASISVDKITDTVQRQVALLLPAGIRTQTTSIAISWIAEAFTEKSFTIPIEVNQLPEGEVIHLFPQTTTVIARVGISHFQDITAEDIRAVCAYPQATQMTLPVNIICNNPYITQIRSSIRDVEYIIERKQ